MREQDLEHLEILITDPHRLHELLDNAERQLRNLAAARGHQGILVTRHSPARYSVALSKQVPFGESREQHSQ